MGKQKGVFKGQLLFYAPDILGIQEGLHTQVSYLDDHLKAYDYVGVGRDDGKTRGEYAAIFYRPDRLKLLGDDTFWLSETPQRISVGWDASMERICTYAFFMDKQTGISFLVFNTHFDHIGKIARQKSAQLILKKINELNKDGWPVIVMGDFNLNDQSQPIQLLSSQLSDARMESVQNHLDLWHLYRV